MPVTQMLAAAFYAVGTAYYAIQIYLLWRDRNKTKAL